MRLTIALQFQSVAAVAPLLGAKFDASLADIGLLIGIYFTPGVALSLPGGAVGKRIGDKGAGSGALVVMLIGQLTMVVSDSWGWQIAGRIIAGSGAVLLGVILTKMVTDWFAGKEIATAMAIFVTSWPVGIATSLLTLPMIGAVYGVSAAYLSVAALIGLGIPLLVVGYRSPSIAATAASAASRLDRSALFAVITAGLIWGVFNIGFTMIFSFGPTLLVERGWSITAAGSAISIVLWLAALGGIAGGFLADWTGRPQSVLVTGCVLFALLMLMLPRSAAVIPIVIAIGAISALPAGPIMSLPARVLQLQTRAIGMGIFFTVFFVVMMLGPAIGGAIAKWTGSAAGAFDVGTAALLACLVLLWGYNRIVLMNQQDSPK
ncbi:CynX/NimT family MFS transporter [Bradyrhizobium jicamae]|uniref:MFS transporter n=1 Tax=Bradyrhizobium jicamae TaxID=280332 RepID=UPI001FD915A3|nr:MFS transporter [Bradyrhizobium jicamae]